MEQNPFNSSENASSGDNKDKKSEGLNVAKSAEPAYEPRSVERVAPAAPALERVISLWDRQTEEESRRTSEESPSEKTESEEGKDSKKKNKGKDTSKTQPVVPARPFQPPAETQVQQAESTTEATEGTEAESEEQPQAEAIEAPAAAVRTETLDEGENPSDDTHAPRQASTPRATDRIDSLPPSAPVEAPAVQQSRIEHVPEYARPEEEPKPFAAVQTAPFAAPSVQANVYPWPSQLAAVEASQAFTSEQNEDEDAVPVLPQAAANGDMPSLPPEVPPSPDAFPNQYMHPAVGMEAQYNTMPGSPNAAPNVAPVMPIEHPLYNSNRDTGARQAAAILGVGLWAEHRGRKKADRRLEKADQQTQALIERQSDAMAINQRQNQESQRRFANEQMQQSAEMNRMRQAQERFAAPPVPPSEQFRQQQSQPQFESAPNTSPIFASVGGEMRMRSPLEQQPPKTAERAPSPVPMTEQQVAEQMQAEQAFNLSPNQHVEHSAWHNIVVDDRGHEVAGAIQYGEGFQRERQQEVIRDRMGDSSQQGGGAAGQFQQDAFGPMYPGALPSGMTNPTLPQGKPTHADPQHQLEAGDKPASNMSNPWFWIMVVLIIAAFFTAALV